MAESCTSDGRHTAGRFHTSAPRNTRCLDGRVDLGDATISMYLLIAITLDQDTAQSSYLVRMLYLIMTNTTITQLIVYMTRTPYTDLPEITLLELYLATKDLVRPKSRTQIFFCGRGVARDKTCKK